MTKSAEPSTPSGSSETQQRRRQITSYKNTTTSPATDIPGTKKLFSGIKDETEARNLWSYLRRFGRDGQPE